MFFIYKKHKECIKQVEKQFAKFYRNENDIGSGIKEGGVSREKIFVVTKLFSTDGGRESAINAVKESLELMKTDYIDQYLLHAPQGGKVLECYDVFLDYQKKGIIKSVGVSNFGVQHLNALKNSGRPLPQVNQIELHPWCQNTDIVKWCRDHNVAVVGYSPLSKGGKINHPFAVQLAKKYNKTPAQILIRWSLQKGFVTIPKSSDPRRIEENANVFDFCFTDEEMASFDDIGRNFKENCTWDPTKNDMSEFGPTK
jgi:methylglyoxal/glyoxal reductase